MWWIINFDIWAIFVAAVIMLLYLLIKITTFLYDVIYSSAEPPLMDEDERVLDLASHAQCDRAVE
jgi:hypothetical protein